MAEKRNNNIKCSLNFSAYGMLRQVDEVYGYLKTKGRKISDYIIKCLVYQKSVGYERVYCDSIYYYILELQYIFYKYKFLDFDDLGKYISSVKTEKTYNMHYKPSKMGLSLNPKEDEEDIVRELVNCSNKDRVGIVVSAVDDYVKSGEDEDYLEYSSELLLDNLFEYYNSNHNIDYFRQICNAASIPHKSKYSALYEVYTGKTLFDSLRA